MMLYKKPLLFVILIIAALIIGFIYLLRGCLSKYDERSSLAPVVYAKKDDKAVVFSIVKFEKTTSYSKKGYFISKTVNTTFYAQNNNAINGQKIAERKLKHHSDIKHFPIEVMGEHSGIAWVFMGEPMAFDVFTLEEVANADIIGRKNSSLKNRLPEERRFYSYDPEKNTLAITATDGSFWVLDGVTLLASPAEEDSPGSKSDLIKNLEKALKSNQVLTDSLVKEQITITARFREKGKISPAQQKKIFEELNDRRRHLYATRDSIRNELSRAEKEVRMVSDTRRKIESLRKNNSPRFGDLKCNADTTGNLWYGLYSTQEMESTYERVQFNSLHAETARRKLFLSTTSMKNGDLYFDRENARAAGNNYFLNGGFLVDKATAMPVKVADSSYIIVHKNRVGNDGTVLISRVNTNGAVEWTLDSHLKEWNDWAIDQKRLIVLGNNNESLSGNDCNLLFSIELATGRSVAYDFFTDKLIQ